MRWIGWTFAVALFVGSWSLDARGEDAVTLGGVYAPAGAEFASLGRFSTSSGFLGAQFDVVWGAKTLRYLPFFVVQFPLNLFEVVRLIPYAGAAPVVDFSGAPADGFGVKLGQALYVYDFGVSFDLVMGFPSATPAFSSGLAFKF